MNVAPSCEVPHRRLRILCAEDNPYVSEALVRLLATVGHAAERAPDGLAAWETVSQDLSQFDLVITDHQMPGINGLDLVRLLREARFPGRIVVHSSALNEADVAEYRRLAVDLVIPKSTNGDQLLNAIDFICRAR